MVVVGGTIKKFNSLAFNASVMILARLGFAIITCLKETYAWVTSRKLMMKEGKLTGFGSFQEHIIRVSRLILHLCKSLWADFNQ